MGHNEKGQRPGQTQQITSQFRGGARNLSYQELMERRNKGLCFKCGQHYSPSHQCPDKHLRLLIWEGEEPSSESLLAVEEKEAEEGCEMVCQVLDYRALDPKELSYSKTLKLEGVLAGYPILLLVDSGASHDFIARELVGSLGLDVINTEEFGVSLGNGSKCSSQGICKALAVKVGKHTIVVDAYVLDLGGVDLILGVDWLETCGKTTMDWKRKTLSFEENGCVITLKGYHIKDKFHTPSLQGILQSAAAEGETTLKMAELQEVSIHGGEGDDNKANRGLQEVLERHSSVFRETKGLPPHQTHDHAIVLRPNAKPVSFILIVMLIIIRMKLRNK